MKDFFFRGKRKDNNEWVYGYPIQICGNYFIITEEEVGYVTSIDQFDINYCEVIPETIEQIKE